MGNSASSPKYQQTEGGSTFVMVPQNERYIHVASTDVIVVPDVTVVMLQVIVLLMDPKAHRFELIQSEFHSVRAKVSDILKQIPTAAIEDIFRKKTYKTILNAKGEELILESNLSDYFTDAAVVIAVPEGTDKTLDQWAPMAVPILTNSKVREKLINAGVKQEDLPQKKQNKQKNSENTIPASSIANSSFGTNGAIYPSAQVISSTVMLQVAVLLMDPKTHRFELIQLEFDSARAKVSDILKQIPSAAIEDIFQKKTYKTILNAKGKELILKSNLSNYVTRASVVIAIPKDSYETLDKWAPMAAPILTNSKVHKMLMRVGVEPEDLPAQKPTNKEEISNNLSIPVAVPV